MTSTQDVVEFKDFPKIARLSRPCIVTEKIDGTNAQIFIGEDGEFLTGSRSRWITPEDDNYGFSKWAHGNKETLVKLGPGRHFGEWWGNGIQRGYGLKNGDKRFSLFNVIRWALHGAEPKQIPTEDPRIVKMQEVLPEGVGLVPVLSQQEDFGVVDFNNHTMWLREFGSQAAPGFMRPEGIVVFHIAGNVGFKKTIEKDESPKGKVVMP